MNKIFIIVLGMITLNALASSYDYKKIGPSYYEMKVGEPTTSTVTEKSFNSIPKLIHAQHSEDFVRNKIKVNVNLFWDKPWFTAWAQKHSDKEFSINFWGGVTRIPGMNDNGLALFACHEVAHIIGGEPHSKIKNFHWASAEGQADYYATSICLKKYFNNKANLGRLSYPKVNQVLYKKCESKYSTTKDLLVCLNIMDAIEAQAKVYDYIAITNLVTPYKKMNFLEKSPAVDKTIYNSYPENQCRIETLIAGNFCSPLNYPCTAKDSARPKCWFRD